MCAQNSIYVCIFWIEYIYIYIMLLMYVCVSTVGGHSGIPSWDTCGIAHCHLLNNSPRLGSTPAVLLVFSFLIYSLILFTLNPSLMLMRGPSSSDRACGPSFHSTPLQTPWVISRQRPIRQTHSCQSLGRQEVLLRGPFQRHWFHWHQNLENIWNLQRA